MYICVRVCIYNSFKYDLSKEISGIFCQYVHVLYAHLLIIDPANLLVVL